MTEKRPGKDPGVHVYTSIVDDLRPKGKRSAVERSSEQASEAAPVDPSSSAGTSADLPLPEAPAVEAPEVVATVQEAAAPETAVARGSAKQTMPSTPRSKGIPAPDPRVPEVEKAIARGDWAAVSKLLAATGEPSDLPAPLRLLWAVATKESRATAGTAIDNIAIEAFAELLDIGKQSPIALVIAKRTLRRRAWVSAPAPSAALSSAIIIGGLAIGLGLGWLLTILLM